MASKSPRTVWPGKSGRHADPVGRAPFGPHPDPHRRRWRGHQPRARVCQGGGKGPDLADAQLSKEEIDNLIFAPGFSTAATITNVSGRGVGMDVVRQNVKDLGGRITIESEEGKGTTFTLTLPLTLAISDGMIVKVGDQTLVVPLTHVVESLRPEPRMCRAWAPIARC
jgi:chemotaxis protein histidine kinase CheA